MNWQTFINWLNGLFSTTSNPSPTATDAQPTNPPPAAPTTPTVPPTQPTQPTQPQSPTPVVPPTEPTPIIPTRPTVPLPQEGMNLDFWKLWSNHPTISEQELMPCRRVDDVPNFANQCAIRFGVCLQRSDLFKGFDGVQCWFGHQNQGHSLRAQELATWMRNNARTFGRVEIKSNVTWQDYVDRTGIIFCENFWGENNQGDHIDLWDGTGEFMGSGAFSWEGPAMASGGLDYIERSERVWFWPVY